VALLLAERNSKECGMTAERKIFESTEVDRKLVLLQEERSLESAQAEKNIA
jgi:hypothetical protein